VASRAAEELFLGIQMSGVTGDLQQATYQAAMMVGAYGMDESYFSYLLFGGIQGLSAPDIKPRIEAIIKKQFNEVKQLIEHNREAVIAIAEALILRNELTDIDVKEILDRVEIEHPYTPIGATKERPAFGFGSALKRGAEQSLSRRRRDSRPVALPPPASSADDPGITIIDATL